MHDRWWQLMHTCWAVGSGKTGDATAAANCTAWNGKKRKVEKETAKE